MKMTTTQCLRHCQVWKEYWLHLELDRIFEEVEGNHRGRRTRKPGEKWAEEEDGVEWRDPGWA